MCWRRRLRSASWRWIRAVLARQASSIRQPVGYVLERLAVNVPAFVEEVRRR